ncbi:MAG: anaerobic ribonucleoside-triphosphate reductase activating protein [Clostridia bacterium]|nr:anaerobic ribonucleoside-triphosphate reductase activating protein [Clostridia bacterium]
MKLHGLQKMTLLDFPGRVACTVFLGGCDFRCPFCHNYGLVDGTASPVMDDAEFFRFLEGRRGLLDGVAVTGGEPCLHPDLPDFLRRVRAMGFGVKLDTNGAHPAMLGTLIREGLADYVAMDIKNSPDKYAMTCGLTEIDLAPVRESVRILLRGDTAYEFRTTVVDELHESEDFTAIGRWIAGAARYYLQCFADRDSVPFGNLHAPSADKLRLCAERARSAGLASVELRGVD